MVEHKCAKFPNADFSPTMRAFTNARITTKLGYIEKSEWHNSQWHGLNLKLFHLQLFAITKVFAIAKACEWILGAKGRDSFSGN
jgi:hypothetical protein